VDAVRYFRGLGPARRRRWDRLIVPLALVALTILTVVAAVQQFA